MSGGFGAGFIKGTLVSLIGVAALSLGAPLTPVDPGSKTQVDLSTPAGSGFNAARNDSNPVLPDTDQIVVTEDVPKPQVSDNAGSTPAADTSSAARPTAPVVVVMPAVKPGGVVSIATPTPDKVLAIKQPALGVPMPQIDNPVTEIPVNRLPVVTPPVTEVTTLPAVDETGSLQDPAQTPVSADVTAPPVTPAASALMRNRIVFDNPDGKPLVSVILIDAGVEGLGADMLETFAFPITFAISSLSQGATATAKKLSHKGFEILALAPNNDGQLKKDDTPEGVASALGKVFATLPEAVGLIDTLPAEIQKNPALAEKVIAALLKSGHGFISYNIGLNTTDKKARRQGLAAGIVYRVLDGERESGAVIKRYLDRAVLEAGKTGHVIVIGRTYPETVTAVFSWALSAKAAQVVLAPVSAVLLSR